MRWRTDPKVKAGAANLFRRCGLALFITLAALVVVDMHSTMSSTSHQRELNPALNGLATVLGFPRAVLLVKLADLAVIGVMYRSWRGSFNQDGRFFMVLSVLVTLYGLVVYSNYAGR